MKICGSLRTSEDLTNTEAADINSHDEVIRDTDNLKKDEDSKSGLKNASADQTRPQ